MGAWISALAGLVGVALGAYLASEWQARHWRQETRMRAYYELMVAARIALWRCHDMTQSGDTPVRRAAVREAVLRLRDSVTMIALVGPDTVYRNSQELLEFFTHPLYRHFHDGEPGDGDALRKEGADLLMTFQGAAQTSIGAFRKKR